MKAKAIYIENFRNFFNVEVEFDEKLNVIYGENGQGKTNLLEAISLFSGDKSFRGVRDKNLVHIKRDSAELILSYKTRDRVNKMQININGKRETKLNDLPIKVGEDLAMKFHCVVFAPTHLSLIKDGPEKRRAFLDSCICQISPNYTNLLNQYERALFQRNSLLKNPSVKMMPQESIELHFGVWDTTLASLGSMIYKMRLRYIKELNKHALETYDQIAGNKELLEVKYFSTIFTEELSDVYQMKEIYEQSLKESIMDDLRVGYTQLGINRDDVEIKIASQNARNFASQGQQRSAVLALKFAQCKILENALGEPPVILLDDVMSELDKKRQDFIINKVKDMQVFITCCDKDELKGMKGGKVFEVSCGIVTEERQ